MPKRLKVIIDAQILSRNRISGIGRYTINIIDALVKFNNFDWKILKPKPIKYYRTIWQHFILPKICKNENIDLLFSPAGVIPLMKFSKKTKIVVTIHDLRWKYFPDTIKWHTKQYLNLLTPYSIKYCDAIIAVSNYVKKTIIEHFPTAKDKIYVIYEFPTPNKFRYLKLKRKKQILFIGSIARHKNVHGILKAFLKVYNKIPHNLIIVGTRESNLPYDKEIDTYIKSIPINRIKFTGYLSDDELVNLYNESDFLIFPSFFEGFGLPPLEAMACGCPVLTSNVTSLPEICNNAAIYCNPYDVNDIADKITQLAINNELKEKLREKGFERIKYFDSNKIAKKYIEVFESIIEKR